MGATGGFFGGGGKDTRLTTTTTEQGQQVSGGVALNTAIGNRSSFFGNKNAGDQSFTLNVLDQGAVDASIKLSGEATENALLFGAGAFQEAVSASERSQDQAIALVGQGVNDSFTFAGGALTTVADLANKAREDAFLFSAGVLQNSQADIADQNEAVLELGRELFVIEQQNLEQTINARENLTRDALEFAAGNVQALQDTTGDALSAIDSAVTQANTFSADIAAFAFQSSEQARNDALQFGAGSLEATLGLIAESTGNTLSSLADAQSTTIAAIGEQTKSESTQSLDKLIKVVGVSIAALAAVFVFSRE